MFIRNEEDGTSSWVAEDTTPVLGISMPIEVLALSCKQVEALRDLPEDQENGHVA